MFLNRRLLKNSTKLILIPFAFYFLFFCAITFPLIGKFSTHIFSDSGDGFQHAWNLWWVNKSITQLHRLPVTTNYLQFPWGVSLLAHTLNPANGTFAIFLLKFFTLSESYNIIYVFSFVAGGFGMFLLSYYLSRSYFGALFAGYIYTFCNYHFAHTGHLELTSIEVLPLFFLAMLLFIDKKRIVFSILAAIFLIIQFFLSIYYFLYLLIATFVFALYLFGFNFKKLLTFISDRQAALFLSFVLLSIFISPFVVLFLIQNSSDPFYGGHPSIVFSADLVGLFVPGSVSHFQNLTQFFWSRWSGNNSENNVYLGIIPILFFIYAFKEKGKLKKVYLSYWILIFFVFLTLSLGPLLHLNGRVIPWTFMPYGLLEIIFPPISIMGVPARMNIMAVLSLAVLSSFGFKILLKKSWKYKLAAFIVFAALVIEYLPAHMPSTSNQVPEYVNVLKSYKDERAVIDLASSVYEGMYYQTIHNKPIAFGFLSRFPKSYIEKDLSIFKLLRVGSYSELCKDYNFKYLVLKKINMYPNLKTLKLAFEDEKTLLYDLDPNGFCQSG